MSLTDFLVASALQTPIHVAEDVRPLVVELKRIGNNVNQIAAKVNSGVCHSVGLQEVSVDLKRIYEQLCRIGRVG